ncbi:esterase/lipase family protein [Streptomyces albireticuli]|nr:alpha/beta fold hydrolase [Streptomyces albireticuli]MCD9145860.1 alpha/beta fold hydrolase [Streptomyces albireticuli]MCD9166252.1 alpha/beta fold hydrolase [Streptomyces albireticuli]MCD9196578.1 alpha/beta fold hydrolase [Streptomyces albireticuli]
MTGIFPSIAQAADKFAHRPVVFVHGHGAGPGVWGNLISDAQALGYKSEELLAFDYSKQTPGDTTIEAIAGGLGKYIRDNELASKSPDGTIDIVAHSMGGLVARYYLKHDGGTSTTKHLVTLGTPNHGTLAADAACAVHVKCDVQTQEMTTRSDLLKALSSGSETPGPTAYATFRANFGNEPPLVSSGVGYCDGIVFGGATSALEGAQNFVTGCIAHNDYPSNSWTKEKTLALISDADGVNTPQAAQFACADLQENWGKDKWVGAQTSSCMTVTGTSAQKNAYSELLVRGCGYYWGWVKIWYYAGYKDVTCDVKYEGKGIGDAKFRDASTQSEKFRTMEIRSDSFPVRSGQTVGGSWSFGIHSYQSADYDAHGTATTPSLTVG